MPYDTQVNGSRTKTRIDLISVGDQLCEITAAIRLGVNNASMIRHTKLLMIVDLMSDRFSSTGPEDFVKVNSFRDDVFFSDIVA